MVATDELQEEGALGRKLCLPPAVPCEGIWTLFSMTPWRVSKPGDEGTGEPEADSWPFP